MWPTNNKLTLIYVAWPLEEFNQFRRDVEGSYLKTIELIPELAERVNHGKQAERIMGSASLPNFFRKPFGIGWVLIGNAGRVQDTISEAGIGNAFRDAELRVSALATALSGR